MKKTTVLVSLLVLLAFSGISAYATDTAPAMVIKDASCGIALPMHPYSVFATDSHIVASNDKNGNSKLTCHATLPADATPPTKAVIMTNKNYPAISCHTGFGTTDDWKAVITPSGNVKLTCHINPNPIV